VASTADRVDRVVLFEDGEPQGYVDCVYASSGEWIKDGSPVGPIELTPKDGYDDTITVNVDLQHVPSGLGYPDDVKAVINCYDCVQGW
jgi:hypothetical protein